ncbi:MAG: NosD domain-containing protein, partial [Candidatus Aenigmatarchaeota archaeon]
FESSFNTIKNSIIKNNTYGIYLYSAGIDGPNLIYNNIFNNINNVGFEGYIYPNYWNITRERGKNIWNRFLGYIGGNLWINPNGTSHSDICNDTDKDGFCDDPYVLATDNIDYLPLVKAIFIIHPIFKSLVGLGMGISFFFLVTRFFFDIDLLKTKNPLVSLVLSMIGIAVILTIFISLWGML